MSQHAVTYWTVSAPPSAEPWPSQATVTAPAASRDLEDPSPRGSGSGGWAVGALVPS